MGIATSEVKTLFGRALEIEDPVERAAYLYEACGADARLRVEVQDLLRAREEARDFMDAPVVGEVNAGECAPLVTEKPGTVIGPQRMQQAFVLFDFLESPAQTGPRLEGLELLNPRTGVTPCAEYLTTQDSSLRFQRPVGEGRRGVDFQIGHLRRSVGGPVKEQVKGQRPLPLRR